MVSTIAGITEKVQYTARQRVIAIAAAEDEEVLAALKTVQEMGLAKAICIGDEKKIRNIADRIGFDLAGVSVCHEPQPAEAARRAVAKAKRGEADLVMKGLVGTAPFLQAVLAKEEGIRTGKILSHVSVFEVPLLSRLLVITDCAMNIAPTLQEKVQLIKNAALVAKKLGALKPKVAVVCAVENVNENMPSTLDAAVLAKMCERGQIPDVLVDGPLGLDQAVSLQSARHKGIVTPLAGEADIILVPNLEAGNIMYKTLTYMSQTSHAGLVVGAQVPIVLTSRSDSAQDKVNSIILGLATM